MIKKFHRLKVYIVDYLLKSYTTQYTKIKLSFSNFVLYVNNELVSMIGGVLRVWDIDVLRVWISL